MLRLINPNEISWKVWTLVAVIGGAGALGGSFYAGKYVGSSQPPTVVRLPPRMMPIPARADLANMPSSQAEAPASSAKESRGNRFKAVPRPASLDERSMGPAAETNDS
jgi:hypothetical protein